MCPERGQVSMEAGHRGGRTSYHKAVQTTRKTLREYVSGAEKVTRDFLLAENFMDGWSSLYPWL